jgi:hypothetical protein
LRPIVIEWDGTHVPEDLRKLPPGRYLVSDPYWDDDEITEEEEAAVMEGLADLEAGRVLPYEEVIRELRSRYASDESRHHP